VAIGTVALSFAYFLLRDSGLQNTVLAVTGLVGAISIWFQMKRSKDMAEGEFILSLNTSFGDNDDIRGLYAKLVAGGPLTEADQSAVVAYLTFFETMYLLLKRNVLDMALLDDLFRYRFNIAVTNSDIQRLELLPDAEYYRNIYTLDARWHRFRQSVGESDESPGALRNVNPNYASFVNKDA